MKNAVYTIAAGLVVLLFVACASAGRVPWGSIDSGGETEISAQGAIGRMEATPSGPLYTGNGGKNIRLAILAPEIHGDVPTYLPVYIQGLLNNNFNKYSAINLIDRQNLNKIISEQNIAASGRFSDKDFITIGNLTNAQYFLIGTIQKLSGQRYSLQLSITESATGIRKFTFMKDCSLAELEGRGTIINEATAYLLSQMGVEITKTGKQMLIAGNISVAKAEAGIAKGITAHGEVEALFNIAQAITFDPSNLEALSRLNTLSSNISGGTISQRIVSDIQARDRWLEVFKETTVFFNNHPPFEITYDPNLIQIGEANWAKRTANIGMRIALDPSEAGFAALNALLEGLEKTRRREAWGFSGWPLKDITPKTAGTVVFNSKRSFKFTVDVALLNEKNKKLSNSTITLITGTMLFSSGDKKINAPTGTMKTLQFSNVKIDDLTDTLTIVIVAVNGIHSRDLNASGYMKIDTGDLEKRFQIVQEQMKQQLQEALLAQEQREQEAKWAKERKEQEAKWAKEKREREAKQRSNRIAPIVANVFGFVLVVGVVALIIWAITSIDFSWTTESESITYTSYGINEAPMPLVLRHPVKLFK